MTWLRPRHMSGDLLAEIDRDSWDLLGLTNPASARYCGAAGGGKPGYAVARLIPKAEATSDRLTGSSQAMQQLLTIGTELVRLGGWQASRPPGFPRCGTPFSGRVQVPVQPTSP